MRPRRDASATRAAGHTYMISNIPDIGKLRRCPLLGLAAQDQPSPSPTENWTAVACELGSKCNSPFSRHPISFRKDGRCIAWQIKMKPSPMAPQHRSRCVGLLTAPTFSKSASARSSLAQALSQDMSSRSTLCTIHSHYNYEVQQACDSDPVTLDACHCLNEPDGYCLAECVWLHRHQGLNLNECDPPDYLKVTSNFRLGSLQHSWREERPRLFL